MIIRSVLTKKLYSDLHFAVYAAVDRDPYIQRYLQDPPDFIRNSVLVSEHYRFIRTMAVRVALMRSRQHRMLDQMAEAVHEGGLPEEYLGILGRIKSCLPAGVVRDPPTNYDCRKYAVCPWCRFRKATEIMETLYGLLDGAKQLSVLNITTPMIFAEDPELLKQSYKAVIDGLCKRRKLFFADFVVTVPKWRATHEEASDPDNIPRRFCFNLETTVIGLSREHTELPLPEDILSENMREQAVFGGSGSGTWQVLRPSRNMLKLAIRTAMGFSPSLLSSNLNFLEYFYAMDLQSRFRAVGHGEARCQ